MQGGIYIFRHKSHHDKALIGVTDQKIASRVGPYFSQINNPKSNGGDLPMPTAVRKNPEKYEFGILCPANKLPDNVDKRHLEDRYIKKLQPSFNIKAGGGGSRA